MQINTIYTTNNYPETICELEDRCRDISGKKVSQIASELKLSIPQNLHRHKGWLGELLEIYLGTTAKNKPEPDFLHLGVELKTLPLNESNTPSESTYVSTAPIDNIESCWEKSRVKAKLAHVLWVPIQATKNIAIKDRIIGTPFLWKPNSEQQEILKEDWEELTTMLKTGEAEYLSAKYGKYLQIRPKAANSKCLIDYIDIHGNNIKIVPKGFYLRPSFTKQIVANKFFSNT